MKKRYVKSLGVMAIAMSMLAGTPVDSFAASTSGTVSEEQTLELTGQQAQGLAEVQSVTKGVIDEAKIPEQLNVHVGDDASSQVNVTYTTVADTNTTIRLNKVGDEEAIYFQGESYVGISGKYIHEIAVSGLEAYTEYEYTVGDGFNSATGTFKTALAKNDSQTFTFAYLADTQVSNASNAKALGATLAEINVMNPDFVYLAGDITDRATNEDQWQWLFNNDGLYPTGGEDMFANSLIAITQGNHDNNEMYQHINAPEEADKIAYSFDYGCMRFISLNLEMARYSDDSRAKQEEMLRKEVEDAKANGQWVVVGFHKSLYTGASHIVDGDIIDARKFWCPILAELGVDLVLQGHDHVYSRGFVTAEGENAHPAINEDGSIEQPANAPLYMVGGHAGGLKWYSRKNYTVSEGDPLSLNYEFLDVNSTDTGSDIKKEQVITTFEVSEDAIKSVTYMFKYDTETDQITTDKYVYDEFTLERDTSGAVTSYLKGTELIVDENEDTLEYTVQYDNINEANAFEIALSYDTNVLELTESASCLDDTIFTDSSDENGVASLIIGLQTPVSSSVRRNVAKFSFKIKDGVDVDEIIVKLIKADTVELSDIEDQLSALDISSETVKGEVVTEFYSYEKACDINKDGKVTLADLAIALTKYQTTDEKCDINRDDIVNVLDYVMIASYME
ncbi:MAG: metallophosphoesterase [Butyrivibrio sp.]|nr:metallophosphoesterase [Butyrivibrio sp.]